MSEYLYGRQCVREALVASRRDIRQLLLADGLRPATILEEIFDLAQLQGVPVRQAPRQALADISSQAQGVALEVGNYPYVTFEKHLGSLQARETALILALDLIQDPQNLGSLMRTAEAVGVDLVVIQDRRQVGITPAVSHASAGGVEHLNVASIVNLRRALQEMQSSGFFVFGLERTAESQTYSEVNLTGKTAVVVGSEGEGLRRLTRETCDVLIELPMRGRIGSLNAAIAGSIVLYEYLRQQEKTRERE